MAKIYAPPLEIGDVPKFDRKKSLEHYRKEEQNYIKRLKDYCTKYSDDANAGKIIKEPVADGYALYMVLSVKPVRLIHIPVRDARDFRWVHKWSTKDIKEMIKRQEAIEKLFSIKG